MFNFLSGFLLGIIVTFAALGFGVYKLLLRLNDGNNHPQMLRYKSLKNLNHGFSKHSLENQDVSVETCVWLNTIVSAICVEALSSPVLVENIHKKLHDILNKPEDKPDVLGNIVISDINMGTGLPLIDGVRVLSRAHDDSLHAEVGVRYNGGASFTISTELWMNWPTPKFAALPISLHASFDHFAGTLTASCYWRSTTSFRLLVYFRAPPVFQLRIGSTIGHSTKLVNVLQVSSLLENMIYAYVNKELVFPNGFEIEVEEAQVVCVRKLASVRSITEKGERLPSPQERSAQPAQVQKTRHTGDLSRRGFTVSEED
jgi:hypothetical protein